MEEEYLVYKHTSPSGKTYIGITKDYSRRCKEHKNSAVTGSELVFHKAICKYTWDAFKHEIIIEGISKDEAGRLEQVFIRELGTMVPNGYNMTLGGEGTNGTDRDTLRQGHIANRKDSVKGYSWHKSRGYYAVSLGYLGSTLNFGSFKYEEEAKAKANYLMSLSDEQLLVEHAAFKLEVMYRTKGYTWVKGKKKYKVWFKVDGKMKHYGYYTNEEDAARRADEVKSQLRGNI